jgi:hypothetical protein
MEMLRRRDGRRTSYDLASLIPHRNRWSSAHRRDEFSGAFAEGPSINRSIGPGMAIIGPRETRTVHLPSQRGAGAGACATSALILAHERRELAGGAIGVVEPELLVRAQGHCAGAVAVIDGGGRAGARRPARRANSKAPVFCSPIIGAASPLAGCCWYSGSD